MITAKKGNQTAQFSLNAWEILGEVDPTRAGWIEVAEPPKDVLRHFESGTQSKPHERKVTRK